MKSVSGKVLISAILMAVAATLLYISDNMIDNNENSFDSTFILALIVCVYLIIIYIIIKKKEKTITEYQIKKIDNLYTKKDKRRNIVACIFIFTGAIISEKFSWYYSIPLVIIAIIMYLPFIKKIINFNKTDANE